MIEFEEEPETMTDTYLHSLLNNGNELNIYKPIQFRIEKAKGEKPMKQLFGNYLHSGEICFLAGDTNVGKTLLAVQIADSLSKGNSTLEQVNESDPLKVLYYDFELSNQSLLKRYPEYNFSENFLCPDINDLIIVNEGKFDTSLIRNGIEETGVEVIIIDNISAIALKSTQDQDTALQLMRDLKLLNVETGITIIILAHTPKIQSNIPLHINHIAGAKHLTNFADSVIMLGKSNKSMETRYLKHLKSRNSELIDNVLEIEINNFSFLHFDYIGLDTEINHLSIDVEKEQVKINEWRDVATSIFNGNELSYTDFCNKYVEHYNKAIDTAKKFHKKLKDYNIIVQNVNKKWVLNENGTN